MGDQNFGLLLRNFGMLLGVALPAAAMMMGLNYGWFGDVPVATSVANLVLTYVTTFLPLAVGGLVHHFVLWSTRRARFARTIAVATSPLVLIVFFAGLASPAFLWENAGALVVGVAAYGVLVRPLASDGNLRGA